MERRIKIIITKDYKLQVKLIDSENIETLVQLTENKQEEELYTPCISFNGNFISVCQNSDSAIHFMEDWLTKPVEFTLYSIKFQGKEYHLLAEVLFGIVMSEVKQKVEKEYIIIDTILELPTENRKVLQRIKITLEAIKMKGISMEETEDVEYDYESQGEYLEEILEKKEAIEEHKRMLERAQEINPRAQEKMEEIDMNDPDIVNEDSFTVELAKRFTTKEREAMKLCKLDNYCIFIASRYLETLEEHQNLTQVT